MFEIKTIVQASLIRDAVFIKHFSKSGNVFAISKGNTVYFFQIFADDFLDDNPKTYNFDKNIIKMIPVCNEYTQESNLLLIFSDYRSILIDYNSKILQEFYLCYSGESKISYRVNESLLIIQMSDHHLDLFLIDGNSTLEHLQFEITIPCKKIIDFDFAKNHSNKCDLIVLTSEFNKNKKLNFVRIDKTKHNYIIDETKALDVSNNIYKILSVSSNKQSFIICFSGVEAIRVNYNDYLIPKTSTATIFTPYKILNFDLIDENNFLYIDEVGYYGTVKFESKGTIRFLNVGKIDNPSMILSISSSLSFVLSLTKDSYLMNNFSIIKRFKVPGKSKSIVGTKDYIYVLCDENTIKMEKKLSIIKKRKIMINNTTKIFQHDNNIIITNDDKTLEINPVGELINDSPFQSNLNTIYFKEFQNGKFIQVLNEKIIYSSISDNSYNIIDGNFNLAVSNEEILCVLSKNQIVLYDINANYIKEIQVSNDIISLAINNDYLAIGKENIIIIYDLLSYNIYKMFSTENLIDLIFWKNYILYLKKDEIVFISLINNCEKNIILKGFHSGFAKINNNIMIFGETPVLLLNNETIIYLDSPPIINCFVMNNNICFLMSDFILIGELGKDKYSCELLENFSSIFEIKSKKLLFTQKGKLFMSKSNLLEKDNLLYETEFPIFIKKNQNLFYVFSPSTLHIYDRNGILIETNDYYSIQQSNLIMFNNCLYEIKDESDIINFNNKQTLLHSKQIKLCSLSDRFAVVIDIGNTLYLYKYQTNQNIFLMNSIASLFDDISSVLVYSNYVFCGTSQGKLSIYQIVPDLNLSSFDINMIFEYQIDQSISLIQNIKSSIYICCNTGQILELLIKDA